MGPKTFLLQIVGLTVRYGVDSEEDKTDNMNHKIFFCSIGIVLLLTFYDSLSDKVQNRGQIPEQNTKYGPSAGTVYAHNRNGDFFVTE